MQNLYNNNIINSITDYLLDCNCYVSTSDQFKNKLDYFYHNSKFYEYGAEDQIYQQIRLHFPKVKLHDKDIARIIGRIQELSPVTDEFDNPAPRYICYLNGILDTQDNQLLHFSPSYYVNFQINQNFIQDDASSSLMLDADRLAMLNALN